MTGEKSGTQLSFLGAKDSVAIQINEKANELFARLQNFNASGLDLDEGFKNYFINHHLGNRLFFSMQNSAHIIYQSVKKTGKPIHEINIVDYGAGLGTLYMLAGMLNFKRIVYNDYLPDWKHTAQLICEALKIPVNAYITGDIDEVLYYADKEGFVYDIIASRNVIEHIYSLPFFFTILYKHNRQAVIFSTTSANYHNPAMRLRHYLIHQKIEKQQYRPMRKEAIQKEWPTLSAAQLDELTNKTRGKGKEDFITAIDCYRQNKNIEPVPYLRSNTCVHSTGYWCEHLLNKKEYQTIINAAGYQMEYSAGYWDTHYKSALMNIIGKVFNACIAVTGKKGYLFSPFVNIVAYN